MELQFSAQQNAGWLSKLSRWAAAIGLVGVFAALGVSTGFARDLRLECSVEGPRDISMHARYEERERGRKKFSTELEAAPRSGFSAGQRMVVVVGTVTVGAVRLRTV